MVGEGGVEAPELLERGIRYDRAFQRADRPFVVLGLVIDDAEVKSEVLALRLPGENRLEVPQSLVVSREIEQRDPESERDVQIVLGEGETARQLRHRLLRPIQRDQREPEKVPRVGVFGVQLDGALERGERGSVILVVVIENTPVDEHLVGRRSAPRGPPEQDERRDRSDGEAPAAVAGRH